jgi:hypothetical protein
LQNYDYYIKIMLLRNKLKHIRKILEYIKIKFCSVLKGIHVPFLGSQRAMYGICVTSWNHCSRRIGWFP